MMLLLWANVLVAAEKEGKVLVAGSFIQDLAFYVDSFPLPGETKIGTFVTGPGGKGSNQAVASARQGVKTCFVGTVGHDSFGKDAQHFLYNEGIKTYLTTHPDAGTGSAAIMVNETGQNSIIVFLGANAFNKSETIVQAHKEFCPNVVLLQCEINMDAVMEYVDTVEDDGPLLLLNPAPIPQKFDFALLEKVDILIPNETEFWSLLQKKGAYLDLTVEELATTASDILHAAARTLQVPIIIVTMGEHGSFVSTPEGFYWVRAPKVDVVSTAGAGDCFSGALASQLASYTRATFKNHLQACVEHAVAAASLSVTKEGTAPSMPTYEATTALKLARE